MEPPSLKIELTAIVVIGLVLVTFFILAFSFARVDVRDNLRKSDITDIKRALEQYYNAHEAYPVPSQPDQQLACTSTIDANSWFFSDVSPLIKEEYLDVMPHDTREKNGLAYAYCPVDVTAVGARGFYLQATLEREQADIVSFDEDELRKFDYRILHEDGKVLYRVCGGAEMQCASKAE